MVVLELCLLPCFSFQEPGATAPTPQEAPPVVQTAPSPALVQTLQALEADPEVDPTQFERLALEGEPAIAVRAAWALGQCKQPQAFALLCELVQQAKDPEVRVQAMAALQRGGQNTALPTAITALDDTDHRVRTLAAQLLGRLRRPTSAGALIAMLGREAKAATPTSPTSDLQAAVLALEDMGSAESLLPAATALAGTKARGVGQALTYYFQNQSKTLAPDAEVTLLVAVLDHSEALLRRFAIGRLGELRVPRTASALEARLAKEGKELRPLVEIALAQVRHQDDATATAPAADTAADGDDVLAGLRRRWAATTDTDKLVIGGAAIGSLLALAFVAAITRRRRRAARAAAAAELVSPSDEYLAEVEAESDALAAAADEMLETSAEYAATDEAADSGDAADWESTTFANDEVELADDDVQRR